MRFRLKKIPEKKHFEKKVFAWYPVPVCKHDARTADDVRWPHWEWAWLEFVEYYKQDLGPYVLPRTGYRKLNAAS